MNNLKQSKPLAPNCVIRAALSAELISVDDVISQGVMVEQVGRSHSVFRLIRGGSPFAYIKSFGPSRGQTDGNIERELAILRLAQARKPIGELVPESLAWHQRDTGQSTAVVVTRAIGGSSAWENDAPGGGAMSIEQAWDDLCLRLIKPLANFHRATRDIAKNNATDFPALKNQTPWILTLFSGDTPEELWHTHNIQSLLIDASKELGLLNGIRQTRLLWRSMCVVHADLKHDNVVLDQDQAFLIDWEMARVGDPAWDLAGLSSRFILVAQENDGWGDLEVRCVAKLIDQYANESGLDCTVLTRRCVSYIGAWVLMASIQHQSTLETNTLSEASAAMLHKASVTFTQIDSICVRITKQIGHARTALAQSHTRR